MKKDIVHSACTISQYGSIPAGSILKQAMFWPNMIIFSTIWIGIIIMWVVFLIKAIFLLVDMYDLR